MIQAKVIADSISLNGDRLTTMEVKFHRIILPEVNTHRALSKSASSSRAVPIAKVIQNVIDDPAYPVEWGKAQKGMQAHELLSEDDAAKAECLWLELRDAAVDTARQLTELDVHRQLVSRVLEPFSWQAMVISGTYWQNLFYLRNHPDAQPEFQRLAAKMQAAYEDSTPAPVDYGEWHLPYVSAEERSIYDIEDLKRFAVARCARTSYWNQGKADPKKDLELYTRLIDSDPIHSVPTEMVATPALPGESIRGNFRGWHQLRHHIEDVRGYNSLC